MNEDGGTLALRNLLVRGQHKVLRVLLLQRLPIVMRWQPCTTRRGNLEPRGKLGTDGLGALLAEHLVHLAALRRAVRRHGDRDLPRCEQGAT